MADEKGYWDQIKEAIALTISDTEELAIMRLKDFTGDALFPAIERLASHGVDQIEHKANEATKGLAKEDAFVELVLPTAKAILREKMTGVVAGMARRPIESVLEEGLRALAKVGVASRNRLFSKAWAPVILQGVHWVEARLETLFGIDLDKNGEVGTVS